MFLQKEFKFCQKKNTHNRFAYNSPTNYHSEAILYSKSWFAKNQFIRRPFLYQCQESQTWYFKKKGKVLFSGLKYMRKYLGIPNREKHLPHVHVFAHTFRWNTLNYNRLDFLSYWLFLKMANLKILSFKNHTFKNYVMIKDNVDLQTNGTSDEKSL